MMKSRLIVYLLLAIGLLACKRNIEPVSDRLTPFLRYDVVQSFPSDPSAFTQGLQYYGGYIYKSTGLYGESSLRQIELETGRIMRRVNLPSQYFGEGIAIVDNQIVQLTWREQTAFIFDLHSFRRIGSFQYEGEGWGLAYDGANLIMSDGSAQLRTLDVDSFSQIGTIEVIADGRPVSGLNELAYIQGMVWANVFQTTRLAIINPATGQVSAWVDLSDLPLPSDRTGQEDVLNGIAYDAENDRVFVTGKQWARIYEIKVHF